MESLLFLDFLKDPQYCSKHHSLTECSTTNDLNAMLPESLCGARGLGVMTLLLQSEDRRFNSCRAHHSNPPFVSVNSQEGLL